MSKTLILVEGVKTDIKLMVHILKLYEISSEHEIVSYNTNIYTLYKEMFENNDPETLDLLQVLKEHEHDETKKKIFNERYSDILLVFDLDPQDNLFNRNKILKMLEYFHESSDMGKLYINYPMVESFYHMKSIPDNEYDSYKSSLSELKAGQYKQRVNRENRNHDHTKFATDRIECNIVIKQNLEKAYKLVGEIYDVLSAPDDKKILIRQLAELEQHSSVFVLCTCIFYIVDYNPKLISNDCCTKNLRKIPE